MSFRENLKAELEFQGIIVKELAARTKISKRTLDTYLDSREVLPSVTAAVKIAQALNVSVEYLVTGCDRNMPTHNFQCIKFKDILDDLAIIPKDIFYPIRAALRVAADAERRRQARGDDSAASDNVV